MSADLERGETNEIKFKLELPDLRRLNVLEFMVDAGNAYYLLRDIPMVSFLSSPFSVLSKQYLPLKLSCLVY